MVESKRQAPDENRASFVDRLTKFNLEEKNSIMFAYDIAKAGHGHQGQVRDSGIRYFKHPRAVTLILLDECKIADPTIIKATLLHDVLEDTSIFGSAHNETYEELIKTAQYRITTAFGEETARIVIVVSKPNGIDLQNKTKDEIDNMYHDNLESASPKALLIKMADVLHNCRTLSSTTPEKQARRIREVESIYYNLFGKVLPYYPKEGKYLLEQIRIAVDRIKQK